MLSGLYHVTLLSVQLNAESFCCWGERTVDTMLEGHMRVWAVASREGASRGWGEGGLSQGDCDAVFWSLPGWDFLVRGGGQCSMLLGPYCLRSHSFFQFWACCSSTCRPLVWKELGSWVLLYFNHLMTLCPVQYQFVKVGHYTKLSHLIHSILPANVIRTSLPTSLSDIQQEKTCLMVCDPMFWKHT